MANLPPSHYDDIGQLGEDLVAQWMESIGWVILHRRFTCRWGEIDIIAQDHDCNSGKDIINPISSQYPTLAFVEVKTRSSGNWDAGGRSAITLQKQAKLSRTAGIFLAEYPQMADYACRFDVAIVYYQRILKQRSHLISSHQALLSASVAGYQFYLQEYIPAAFDSSIDS
ncbi:YraN family protein [Halotia wernerae UHCC 0503]|nr:YraN family protein [Halotia wernerae UHCC 0503]